MNIWHDIEPERIYPTDFTAVVEISKGSNMKYELDKKTGMLSLDRVVYCNVLSHELRLYSQNIRQRQRPFGRADSLFCSDSADDIGSVLSDWGHDDGR